MNNSSYQVLDKFNCCGIAMVTVIINKAACVMLEKEYNLIIKNEKKHNSLAMNKVA